MSAPDIWLTDTEIFRVESTDFASRSAAETELRKSFPRLAIDWLDISMFDDLIAGQRVYIPFIRDYEEEIEF